MTRCLTIAVLVTCVTLPHTARAQDCPNPFGTGRGIGYGAALIGSADVLRAYRDVIVQQKNARILREKAKQAKQGQAGELEIVNHRPTYGYLGAPRPKVGLLPGDTAHFTFEIKNLKLDENGKASYSIAIEIRDEAGKLVYEQRPYNSVAQNFLGGDTLPCSAHVEIPIDSKPGAVDWKVTVKDRTTNQTATLAGKGKILEPAFGIVQVGLFADADIKVPMSAIAVVGDSAYLHFSAVGFARDKDKKQPDLNVSLRIVDEKGKATLAKPLMGKINTGVGVKDDLVPMTFGLTMNRAGRFTIELTAEDRHTGKSATIAYAIRVLPLE